MRNIVILESKYTTLDVDTNHLKEDLFGPLRELYPNAYFYYILFADKDGIFVNSDSTDKPRKWRQIKPRAVEIYHDLKDIGVSTLFFKFDESREDLNRMKSHLINYYEQLNERSVLFSGKIFSSKEKTIIYNSGPEPHSAFVKLDNGLYEKMI